MKILKKEAIFFFAIALFGSVVDAYNYDHQGYDWDGFCSNASSPR